MGLLENHSDTKCQIAEQQQHTPVSLKTKEVKRAGQKCKRRNTKAITVGFFDAKGVAHKKRVS